MISGVEPFLPFCNRIPIGNYGDGTGFGLLRRSIDQKTAGRRRTLHN
jgi:hypothetical protein